MSKSFDNLHLATFDDFKIQLNQKSFLFDWPKNGFVLRKNRVNEWMDEWNKEREDNYSMDAWVLLLLLCC